MNISGVCEMGVGEMGQIIGDMGVGEMGVGETGTSLSKPVNENAGKKIIEVVLVNMFGPSLAYMFGPS